MVGGGGVGGLGEVTGSGRKECVSVGIGNGPFLFLPWFYTFKYVNFVSSLIASAKCLRVEGAKTRKCSRLPSSGRNTGPGHGF